MNVILRKPTAELIFLAEMLTGPIKMVESLFRRGRGIAGRPGFAPLQTCTA